MIESRPSMTAHRVALQRAAHQILDAPRVLDDPVAIPILGPGTEGKIRTHGKRMNSAFVRGLRGFVVARSRRAEDAVAEAVHSGVGQYVVLGAGLDTFAYRNPFEGLRVFEVDFPATQEWKRRRLAEAGIASPASLTYVPIDFQSDVLADRLAAAGFRADRPAFFSWLGVTMYVKREVVLATAAFVASLPAGSGITMDYFTPPSAMPFIGRVLFHSTRLFLQFAGEPWTTWFDPGELEAELRRVGFTRVENLDWIAINDRYFQGKMHRLGGRGAARIVTATK